jgi:hypothetical protein
MLALALSAIVHNAPIRSGIFLALAMVKPTTPILFAVGTFCWAISHRKPYHFIGFALTLLLLTFASEVFCPGIVGSWMQARPDILNYAISTKHAVFGDAMQQIIYDYSDLWLGFPVYLAFILGLCLTIGGWIVFGKQNSLAYWFPLICISAAFAPSAFFMDHSIIAIPLLGMLALACRPEISERTRDIIIAMLVGYFFLALGLMWLLNNYVYWFLIPLLLLPLTLVPLALVQPKSP